MQNMQDAQNRQERQLLTAEDVSRLLHVDASTVYRMASDGRLPAVKVGRQWRFPADRIARLLDVPFGGEASGEPATLTEQAQPVVDVAAELLGVMMVVTDMSGRPVTAVANPCPWFQHRLGSPEGAQLLDRCLAEWRLMADDPDLQPRFHEGALGFECARALVRDGSRLVGMVLAGGVAPDGQPADGRYVLDDGARARVLATLPKVAATLSRSARPPLDLVTGPVGSPTTDEGAVR
jgi:excisionase family DNA binding protein